MVHSYFVFRPPLTDSLVVCFCCAQYSEVLSRGASKVAYKGLDQQTGEIVAWNQLAFSPQQREEGDQEQLDAHVQLLKSLNHENVLRLHECWVDEEQHMLNFITEYFNPGPLRR